MASHFRLGKYQLFANGVMTGTSVLTSPAVHILNLDNVYLQLDFTGTPTGTFAVQVSGDHTQDQEGNVLVAGHWVTLVLNPAPAAAGSALDIGIDLNQLGAPYVRVVYTNTSGVGVLNGFVSGKGLM